MSLSFDPSSVRLEAAHYIGGTTVQATGEIALARPSDGKVFSECPIAGSEVVDQAVEAARTAVKVSGWSVCHPRDRVKAMVAWLIWSKAMPKSWARLKRFHRHG